MVWEGEAVREGPQIARSLASGQGLEPVAPAPEPPQAAPPLTSADHDEPSDAESVPPPVWRDAAGRLHVVI